MQHYIFSQGHVGESQWEGRERRENYLLMHWPFQKEPGSTTGASHLYEQFYIPMGKAARANSSYLTTAVHWAAINSGIYLGVLWPGNLWEHNITGLQIGLFGGFKVCGSDYLTKNSPSGLWDYKEHHGSAYPWWAMNNTAMKRAREGKRKGAQSLHRKAL